MALDPEVAAFLEHLGEGPGSLAGLPLPEARAALEGLMALGGAPEAPVATEDTEVAGGAGPIPVRLYRPPGLTRAPLVVFFHGGGFVLGGLSSHDAICHRLSADVGAVVAAVDYRLAPEHPFPAAVEDAWAATVALAASAEDLGADGSKVAVVGDSAGGNLAAVVARRARDHGAPDLALQVLVYPVTDMAGPHPSREANGQGYLLTSEAMAFFERSYCAGAPRGDPDLSPLLAPELSGLAPAFVLTAGFDPLRDEGEAYASALKAAGVPVTAVRHEGMVHGFYGLDALFGEAKVARRQVASALEAALKG